MWPGDRSKCNITPLAKYQRVSASGFLYHAVLQKTQQNSHHVANRITKNFSSALIDNALGINRASASGSSLAAQMASPVIVSTEGTGLRSSTLLMRD